MKKLIWVDETLIIYKTIDCDFQRQLIVSNSDYFDNMEEKEMLKKLNIKKVIYNEPATIVYWENGDKTVVKAQDGESFDKEKGLAMALVKRMHGDNGNYNNIFKKWVD